MASTSRNSSAPSCGTKKLTGSLCANFAFSTDVVQMVDRAHSFAPTSFSHSSSDFQNVLTCGFNARNFCRMASMSVGLSAFWPSANAVSRTTSSGSSLKHTRPAYLGSQSTLREVGGSLNTSVSYATEVTPQTQGTAYILPSRL